MNVSRTFIPENVFEAVDIEDITPVFSPEVVEIDAVIPNLEITSEKSPQIPLQTKVPDSPPCTNLFLCKKKKARRAKRTERRGLSNIFLGDKNATTTQHD